jgi:hypothetical protein
LVSWFKRRPFGEAPHRHVFLLTIQNALTRIVP